MIRVLIADDEQIIRDGLVSSIDWEGLGMELCAAARNGREALQMAREQSPDLCLVDIMMPQLNGLAFVEKLREVRPDTVIIIITGYDEFEYAQRAIKLGTLDYLLKPINEKELNDSLVRAAELIRRRQRENFSIDGMKENLQLLYPQALKLLIRTCLDGEGDPERREAFERTYGTELGTRLELLMFPRADLILSKRDGIYYTEAGLIDRILAVCGEYGKDCGDLLYADVDPDAVLVVLRAEEGAQEGERLRRKLSEETGCELVCCSGTAEGGPESLGELRAALRDRIRENERYSPVVRRVKDYIDAHFTDSSLSLHRIAGEFRLSEGHISRNFKSEMKLSYTKYIEKKRMELAARMLLDDSRIVEVAEKVGYTSQHYFCTAFKKNMGCAPSDYKKRVRHEE